MSSIEIALVVGIALSCGMWAGGIAATKRRSLIGFSLFGCVFAVLGTLLAYKVVGFGLLDQMQVNALSGCLVLCLLGVVIASAVERKEPAVAYAAFRYGRPTR